MATLGYWGVGYFVVGLHTDLGRALRLETVLDRAAPFWPSLAILYVLCYVLIIFPHYWIRDVALSRRMTIGALGIQTVALLTFLLYPVTIDRPPVEPHSFATWILAIVYAADPPTNLFPSLHVAWTFNNVWALLAADPPVGRAMLPVAIGVAVSTVLVRQHYVADVLYGLLLALAVYSALWQRARVPAAA